MGYESYIQREREELLVPLCAKHGFAFVGEESLGYRACYYTFRNGDVGLVLYEERDIDLHLDIGFVRPAIGESFGDLLYSAPSIGRRWLSTCCHGEGQKLLPFLKLSRSQGPDYYPTLHDVFISQLNVLRWVLEHKTWQYAW